MKRIGVSLLVLLAGSLEGCGRSDTVIDTDGTTATVTKRGDGVDVTVKGPDGGTVRVASGEEGVSVPEGFPKDVPLYPGAIVTTAATVQNAMNVVLKTKDPISKVTSFYKEKMKDNGWEIQTAVDTADGTMLNGHKENRTQMTVMARDGDHTIVTLAIETEK